MDRVDVVVIDNDYGIRWIMREILSVAGIPHRVTGEGAEGIAMAQEHKPRLAIVDLNLGGMTGLQVARKIHEVSDDTRVLVVTGYLGEIEGALHYPPIVGVIEKPFDVDKLLEAVRGILGK
ncbi:MAG: response regulator [Bacillota bacterium]